VLKLYALRERPEDNCLIKHFPLQTSASIMAFFYAMFLFPEVFQRVYEEIAAVTEGTRMPRMEDRPRLPFTEATWKEAWRWNPFFPFGTKTNHRIL
jgi:cytochrome P450